VSTRGGREWQARKAPGRAAARRAGGPPGCFWQRKAAPSDVDFRGPLCGRPRFERAAAHVGWRSSACWSQQFAVSRSRRSGSACPSPAAEA